MCMTYNVHEKVTRARIPERRPQEKTWIVKELYVWIWSGFSWLTIRSSDRFWLSQQLIFGVNKLLKVFDLGSNYPFLKMGSAPWSWCIKWLVNKLVGNILFPCSKIIRVLYFVGRLYFQSKTK